MNVVPVTMKQANGFIRVHHRHSKPARGGKFFIGARDGDVLLGIAIVSRPVSRIIQEREPLTGEVIRVCVREGAPLGTNSFLYAACWRIWREMGGDKIITYTLQEESGASLRGAGWIRKAKVRARAGKAWSSHKTPRATQAVTTQLKWRWEMARDYSNDVDWRGSFPTERVALGLVGSNGFRTPEAAAFCRKKLKHVLTVKGKRPSAEAILARMHHSARCKTELAHYEATKPRYFKKGQVMAKELMQLMEAADIPVSLRTRRWQKKPETKKIIRRSNGA